MMKTQLMPSAAFGRSPSRFGRLSADAPAPVTPPLQIFPRGAGGNFFNPPLLPHTASASTSTNTLTTVPSMDFSLLFEPASEQLPHGAAAPMQSVREYGRDCLDPVAVHVR